MKHKTGCRYQEPPCFSSFLFFFPLLSCHDAASTVALSAFHIQAMWTYRMREAGVGWGVGGLLPGGASRCVNWPVMDDIYGLIAVVKTKVSGVGAWRWKRKQESSDSVTRHMTSHHVGVVDKHQTSSSPGDVEDQEAAKGLRRSSVRPTPTHPRQHRVTAVRDGRPGWGCLSTWRRHVTGRGQSAGGTDSFCPVQRFDDSLQRRSAAPPPPPTPPPPPPLPALLHLEHGGVTGPHLPLG